MGLHPKIQALLEEKDEQIRKLRSAARGAAFVLRQAAANENNDAENRIVYAGAAEALEDALENEQGG